MNKLLLIAPDTTHRGFYVQVKPDGCWSDLLHGGEGNPCKGVLGKLQFLGKTATRFDTAGRFC